MYCPRCTTTRSLSVGSRVTHWRARVGVIAFQAVADPRMGYLAMKLFYLGYSAPKVVRELQDSDPHAEMRQIAAIDGDGNIAAVTVPRTRPWTGHQQREHPVAMGNVLTSERTVTAMTERFEATADMPLEDRLMLAIEAGRDAGGQVGGQVSAALLVFDTQSLPHVDLRVDARVLVPRPDTETLVDWALALLGGTEQRVLDLGTGSGAIALALKHAVPELQVAAVEAISRHTDPAVVALLLETWENLRPNEILIF